MPSKLDFPPTNTHPPKKTCSAAHASFFHLSGAVDEPRVRCLAVGQRFHVLHAALQKVEGEAEEGREEPPRSSRPQPSFQARVFGVVLNINGAKQNERTRSK